jgi:hypothetical protein
MDMDNPFVPSGTLKPSKAPKPRKLRGITGMISEVHDTGAHGRVGKENAVAIRDHLEAHGYEIVAKPHVEPVEVKRADPVKPPEEPPVPPVPSA